MTETTSFDDGVLARFQKLMNPPTLAQRQRDAQARLVENPKALHDAARTAAAGVLGLQPVEPENVPEPEPSAESLAAIEAALEIAAKAQEPPDDGEPLYWDEAGEPVYGDEDELEDGWS